MNFVQNIQNKILRTITSNFKRLQCLTLEVDESILIFKLNI